MKRIVVGVVVLGLAVAGFVYLPGAIGYLRIGTTFAAQQTCSCVHLSGRALASCLGDLGQAAKLVDVRVDGDAVRASALFGLFSGESRHEAPYGCHPVK